MRKKKITVWTFVTLVLLGVLLGMKVEDAISGDSLYDQMSKISEVFSLLQKDYVDPVNTQKLGEAAINGMLGALDPHSVYISTDQMKKVDEDFKANFEGIGIQFEILSDTITVVTPIAGGPSEALGIYAGDRIVKIDTMNAVGLKDDDVVKHLRGPKGTHVQVTIVRHGVKDPLTFDITRDKIPIYTVTASLMWDNKTGYININRFAATTQDEVVEAIQKLKSEGMTQLIIDLRDNPGGYLDQAWKVADDFVPGGRKIVYTKGRMPDLGFDEEYNSTPGGIAENIPLIVLVDKYSASASEIVSGAIQDNDRGLIVGNRTFGKGLVQRQFTMADGSGVRITIARYYTPSGRLIQRPYEKGETAKYYAALQSRKDLPEGDNISHAEDQSDTSKAYHTFGGRVVYGGGGITPDYIIDADTLTQLEKDLWSKNTYTEFVDNWMSSHRNELIKEYKTYQQFKDDFKISPELQQQFMDYAKNNKKIEFTSEQFKRDKELILSQICSYMARNIWNFDGFYDLALEQDVQFQKALTLFPEAIKIAHLESMR